MGATPSPAFGAVETMRYSVGVMTVPVEEQSPTFRAMIERAVATVERTLRQRDLQLALDLCELRGPHLSPQAGAYSPLDFLQIGFSEHLVRRFLFLLLVTEVDLAATGKPYVLALSSPLANIGILSTRRLAPEHWGEPDEEEVQSRRLAGLMLHVLGHLLNLSHHARYVQRHDGICSRNEMDRAPYRRQERQRPETALSAPTSVGSKCVSAFAASR